MYDWFMLIAGIIFIILTIVTSLVLVTTLMVCRSANNARTEANKAYLHYMDAIERSNETVVEKFRHDLDCHKGELPY